MFRILLILFALPYIHGCTLFSKTEVVRPNETERPVLFESQDAEDVFREAVKKLPKETENWRIGGNWVTLYERSSELSEAARFNRAVAGCDTSHDRIISNPEAARFAERSR